MTSILCRLLLVGFVSQSVMVGTAWAANTYIDLNANSNSANYVDSIGTQEITGSYPSGSGYARANASFGVLKAESQANEIGGVSGSHASASVLVRDSLMIDAGTHNGQSGFVDIVIDYEWQLSSAVTGGTGWSRNTADVGVELGPTATYAREYRYSGTRFGPLYDDIIIPFGSVGDGVQLLDAELGNVLIARMPVVFGVDYIFNLSLSVSSLVIDGTASVEAFNSVYWGGLTAYDTSMQPISVVLSAESGTDYSRSFAPVPEPETWAMLLAGLGLVGFATAKRRV